MFGLGTFEFKPLLSFCIMVIHDNALQKAYTSAMMLTMNAFVITTLTFCYYRISKYLRLHQVNMSTSSNSNLRVQEIKITKTLFFLVLVSVFLWIPTFILAILFRVNFLPQKNSQTSGLSDSLFILHKRSHKPLHIWFHESAASQEGQEHL